MGRFNWIWRTLQTLSVIACGVGVPGTATAAALTDADFNTAIAACLAEDPVDGVCTNYGESSGFGTMPNWDTSQVTDMSQAFSAEIHSIPGVANFNADIGSWNTSKVIDMTKMFRQCDAFNSDISSWDVGSVTHFKAMFFQAKNFNIDIGQWDVSSGQDFFWMFWDAFKFNQDISGWDVTSADTLGQMFRDANGFAQDIRGWDVSSIPEDADWQLFGGADAMLASDYTLNINTRDWFIADHPTDFTAPTITSVEIGSSNDEILVEFSEAVYTYTSTGDEDLRATDFALSITGGTATLEEATPTSITKLDQGYWSLGFSTSGSINGLETISVVPAGGTSIQDAAGNTAEEIQSNNTANLSATDLTAPTITSVEIGSSNDEILVEFSEAVYTYTSTGDEDLRATDFALSITGGTATLEEATPTSITKLDQGYWSLGFSTSGSINGLETISVVPAGGTSIQDAAGNTAEEIQSNNTANLSATDLTAPTITSVEIGPSNDEILVEFSEAVYTYTSTGDEDLRATDFALSITGGTATLEEATPTSITKLDQGYWSLGFSTSGSINGLETISVVPAGGTSIQDAAGNTAEEIQSNNTANLSATDLTAPTITSVDIGPSNDQLVVEFSEAVYTYTSTGDEDLRATDFALSITGGTATLEEATPTSITKLDQGFWLLGFSTSGSINGLETISVVPAGGTSIQDAAGNTAEEIQSNNTANLSATNTAATDFAAAEDAIRSVITDDATRSLTSILNANERMVGEARERLIASQQEGEEMATRDNVPFDVDGTFNLDGNRLSTKGTFFEQRGTADGAGQRLFFGDFDVQHDGDTNSTTATITARMAWEQMYTDSTMLGYFVGGELAHSNIKGSFEGEQDRLGVSFGGYAVHQLDEQVFVDGFITVGAGRNNLEIADATLDLTSDYTTRTATMGAAVSGVYEYGQYDFHPELAFSYGKTWIGDVGFTGVAYGLTDDALSLDAGDVSIANLTLRPEIVWALDAETIADSNTQLSFAPRFICQRTSAAATAQDCGAGAEIGLSSTSEDGLSSANIRLVMDRVGNSNRSSFALNFDRRF